MPQIAGIVGGGYPYHIVQKGNNREEVFLDPRDYEKYLSFLVKAVDRGCDLQDSE